MCGVCVRVVCMWCVGACGVSVCGLYGVCACVFGVCACVCVVCV